MSADYGEFRFLFLRIGAQHFPADIHSNCLAKMVLFHLCNVCKKKTAHLITPLAFHLWFLPSSEIETVKLARLVFSKLHEICSNWVKDFPLQPKPHRYYETSIHAIKNMRRKMEDKHVCIPDFNMLFNLEVKEMVWKTSACAKYSCCSWGKQAVCCESKSCTCVAGGGLAGQRQTWLQVSSVDVL